MSICPPHAGTSGPVAYTATFSTRGDFALFSPQGQLARSGDIFGHHTLGDATLGHLTAYGTKGKYLLMFCFQQGNHGEELMRSFQQKWGQGSEGHVPAQGRTTQTFLRRHSGRLCLLIFVLSSVPQGKSPRIRKKLHDGKLWLLTERALCPINPQTRSQAGRFQARYPPGSPVAQDA